MRARRLAALLAATLLPLLGAPAAAQPAPDELRVGIVAPSAPDWDFFVAEQQGFFRDQRLHVTLITAGSPANAINMLVSNAVEIISDSTDSMIGGIARGLPIRIFAPGFQPDPYTLLTTPGITSWEQLRGKTVILGPKLDVTAFSFDRMAAAQHMTQKDFNVIVAPSTVARYAALSSGHVDAAILAQPFDIVAERRGMHVLAHADDYIKLWLFEGIAARPAWLASHRDAAVRFVRALAKADAFAYAHPAETIAALVGGTRVDEAVAAAAYDLDFRRWHAFDPQQRFSEAAIRAVAERALGAGTITQIPPMSAIYDPSIVQAATR